MLPKSKSPSTRPKSPLSRQLRFAALCAVITLSIGLILSARQYLPALVQAFQGASASSLGLAALTRTTTLGPMVGFLVAIVIAHLAFLSLPVFIQRTVFNYRAGIRDSLVVTALLTTLLLIGLWYLNESLFPHSSANVLGLRHNSIASGSIGLGSLAIVSVLLALATILISFRFITRYPVASLVFSAALLAAFIPFKTETPDRGESLSARPNVFLIGIDSLRPDHVSPAAHQMTHAPAISAFLKNAIVFDNASTVIGRSFPSWLSVFSGLYPHISGARYNLQAPDFLGEIPLLPQILRESGYTTIYATDETRFANIDERLGFDFVISPGQGLEDFLIISFSDLPIINLLSNAPIIDRLFPYVSINRQSKAYMPATFSRNLERRLKQIHRTTQKPMFLVVDFAAAHYPYHTYQWNLSSILNPTHNQRVSYPISAQYAAAVGAADEQYESLKRYLDNSGLSENALMFVFSDHGENLGEGSQGYTIYSDEPISFGLIGHGVSIFDDRTHQVVLAIKDFRSSDSDGGRVSEAVELIDIAPTLLSLIGIPAPPSGFSGKNLLHRASGQRYRLRESGIRLSSLMESSIDEVSIAQQAMRNFRVSAEGLLEVRRTLHEPILHAKQRGLELNGTMIAHLGITEERDESKWIIVDRSIMGVFDYLDYPDQERAHFLRSQFCNVYQFDPFFPMQHDECLSADERGNRGAPDFTHDH